MSIHGPQWDRDEEFRQSVIRKALLLGFEGLGRTVAPAPTFLASALAASFSLAQ